MIRSILRIPQAKLDSLETNHKLTTYDRKSLEDLVDILTPFETATHCVQGSYVVTRSMVVPCVKVLKKTFEDLSIKYSSRLVSTLKTSITTRLSKYEEYNVFLLASVLDPRFKLKWCSPAEYHRIKGILISKIEQSNPSVEISGTGNESQPPVSHNQDEAEPPTKKMRTFFDTLIDTSSSNITTPTDIESMIEEYLQSPCLPQESDPLEENNKSFPN